MYNTRKGRKSMIRRICTLLCASALLVAPRALGEVRVDDLFSLMPGVGEAVASMQAVSTVTTNGVTRTRLGNLRRDDMVVTGVDLSGGVASSQELRDLAEFATNTWITVDSYIDYIEFNATNNYWAARLANYRVKRVEFWQDEVTNQLILARAKTNELYASLYFTEANTQLVATVRRLTSGSTNAVATVGGLTTNDVNGIIASSDLASVAYVDAQIISAGAVTPSAVTGIVSRMVSVKQDALSDVQTNAVNSGITAEKVSTYDGYATGKASVSDVYTKSQVDEITKGVVKTNETGTASVTKLEFSDGSGDHGCTLMADDGGVGGVSFGVGRVLRLLYGEVEGVDMFGLGIIDSSVKITSREFQLDGDWSKIHIYATGTSTNQTLPAYLASTSWHGANKSFDDYGITNRFNSALPLAGESFEFSSSSDVFKVLTNVIQRLGGSVTIGPDRNTYL